MGGFKDAFHEEICERSEYEQDGRSIPRISTANPAQTIVLLRRSAELLGDCGMTIAADVCNRGADLLGADPYRRTLASVAWELNAIHLATTSGGEAGDALDAIRTAAERAIYACQQALYASADTHAKRGDSPKIEAPSPMSGAVPRASEADAHDQ